MCITVIFNIIVVIKSLIANIVIIKTILKEDIMSQALNANAAHVNLEYTITSDWVENRIHFGSPSDKGIRCHSWFGSLFRGTIDLKTADGKTIYMNKNSYEKLDKLAFEANKLITLNDASVAVFKQYEEAKAIGNKPNLDQCKQYLSSSDRDLSPKQVKGLVSQSLPLIKKIEEYTGGLWAIHLLTAFLGAVKDVLTALKGDTGMIVLRPMEDKGSGEEALYGQKGGFSSSIRQAPTMEVNVDWNAEEV